MRLVEGDHRVPDARPEPRAQPRLGQLLHRRQPRHPRVAGLRPQGRRDRPHDARAGCRERVERAGRGVHGREQRRHAQAVRPHDHLRQGGGCGRQARAAGRRAAQGPEVVAARGQAARPPRHRREDQRLDRLRDGPEAPRDAQRRDRRLPGVRRQGEERERGRGDEATGSEEGRARRRFRGRRRCRHLVAGEDRARGAADRVGLRTERQGIVRRVREGARGRARRARTRSSATRWGMRRPRSPRRRASSRRCTPTRTRTTRRWSR